MKDALKLLAALVRLPVRTVHLDGGHEEGKRMYASFTSAHPRMPLLSRKTWGIALIDLNSLQHPDAYYKSVSGKNSAAYFSRKSQKNGYQIQVFDPNLLQDQMLEIHRSVEMRQGKSIDSSYLKPMQYPENDFNRYYGVFKDGKLTGYIWAIRSGELMVINRIMGHKNHLDQGIMYALVLYLVELAFSVGSVRFVMYDTLLNASEGLKMFKKRTGFSPYRVKWRLD
ncbi:MAG: GNAT family N-acetyltransferase [Bacteroidota bacterium]